MKQKQKPTETTYTAEEVKIFEELDKALMEFAKQDFSKDFAELNKAIDEMEINNTHQLIDKIDLIHYSIIIKLEGLIMEIYDYLQEDNAETSGILKRIKDKEDEDLKELYNFLEEHNAETKRIMKQIQERNNKDLKELLNY